MANIPGNTLWSEKQRDFCTAPEREKDREREIGEGNTVEKSDTNKWVNGQKMKRIKLTL